MTRLADGLERDRGSDRPGFPETILREFSISATATHGRGARIRQPRHISIGINTVRPVEGHAFDPEFRAAEPQVPFLAANTRRHRFREFEFGFGLSYTEFTLDPAPGRVTVDGGSEVIEFDVSVTNTGNRYSGKEVVQLYIEAPQGTLGKPARVPGAFAKTAVLAPGESETVRPQLSVERLASYDDSGARGYRDALVLEAGEYRFYIGSSVKRTAQVPVGDALGWTLEQTRLVEQLEEAMAPVQVFSRMLPGVARGDRTYELAYESVPTGGMSLEMRIASRLPAEIPQTENAGYTLEGVRKGMIDLPTFIAQLGDHDLATIVRGKGMSSPRVTQGTAAAFGGISQSLFDLGIPIGCAADGPSGIRMDDGGTATQMPIGTLLAATWNVGMVEELYRWKATRWCATRSTPSSARA